MDKFVASQREMEEKYVELEEKRLKLTKELEEHRQQMQERWCENDHRHELQMWNMMMQMMGGSGLGGHPNYPMPCQFYPPTPGIPPFPPESSSCSSSYPPSFS